MILNDQWLIGGVLLVGARRGRGAEEFLHLGPVGVDGHVADAADELPEPDAVEKCGVFPQRAVGCFVVAFPEGGPDRGFVIDGGQRVSVLVEHGEGNVVEAHGGKTRLGVRDGGFGHRSHIEGAIDQSWLGWALIKHFSLQLEKGGYAYLDW